PRWNTERKPFASENTPCALETEVAVALPKCIQISWFAWLPLTVSTRTQTAPFLAVASQWSTSCFSSVVPSVLVKRRLAPLVPADVNTADCVESKRTSTGTFTTVPATLAPVDEVLSLMRRWPLQSSLYSPPATAAATVRRITLLSVS